MKCALHKAGNRVRRRGNLILKGGRHGNSVGVLRVQLLGGILEQIRQAGGGRRQRGARTWREMQRKKKTPRK